MTSGWPIYRILPSISRIFIFTFCTPPKTGCGLYNEAFLHVSYGTRFKPSPWKPGCGLYTAAAYTRTNTVKTRGYTGLYRKSMATSINRLVASRVFRNHRVLKGIFVTIKMLRVAKRPFYVPTKNFIIRPICVLVGGNCRLEFPL